jgi:MGT family glycosyltransferase
MAHFAILCPEDVSHVLVSGAIGKELVGRGHRVTVVAPAGAAAVADEFGLPLYPLNEGAIPYRADIPLWSAFRLWGAHSYIQLRSWLCWYAEMILQLAPPVLQELAVDGVLVDQTISAGGTAAQRAGVPFVTLCAAMLWNEDAGVPPPFTAWPYASDGWSERRNRLGYAGWHWFIRPVLDRINRYRRRWQFSRLATIEDAYSPLAQISQLCAEFDFARRRLPDVFHYVGSLVANRRMKTECPFPWEWLDGRPLIFASLGTVPDNYNLPVFRKILAACAGIDAQLVLTLGAWEGEDEQVRAKLGEIPPNALVVDFAPQQALLDRAAVLITHAGVNTVLESLSRAVPIVALPRSADQPAMGSRIAHAGVGLLGSFRRSTAWQIRELVERVLSEETFRQRAQDMQKALAAAGGVCRAAEIAERALLTGRPVPRAETAQSQDSATSPQARSGEGISLR